MSEERAERTKGMPRRIALRVIGGSVPATLAVGRAEAGAPHQAPAEPGAAQRAAHEWRFLTERERETAALLADMVIPADEVSGGATEAGAVEYIDEYAAEWEETRVQLRGGFRWLDRECSRRFGAPFTGCEEPQRRELLDLIAYPGKLPPLPGATGDGRASAAAAEPADPALERLRHGVEFFNLFRNLVAGAFYTTRIGIDDLQFTGNAPVAWNGCPPHVLKKLGV